MLHVFVRVDYIIAPLKILQSLKESPTLPDDKYSFVRRLSPTSAMLCNFSADEVGYFFDDFFNVQLTFFYFSG